MYDLPGPSLVTLPTEPSTTSRLPVIPTATPNKLHLKTVLQLPFLQFGTLA